ncbi:MAG: aspartate kinase, partial [Bacteroidetes bacterium]|nr:aspartate kinase [Bacteroidota bacterium]
FPGKSSQAVGRVRDTLRLYADELSTLVKGVAVLGELTPRSLDAFLAYGERMSSLILQQLFKARGMRSALVDARTFMITDEQFTKAQPKSRRVGALLRAEVRPRLRSHDLVLTQGFIGTTATGITTTVGRGGSDFSASYIGALLNAREIQIWTDVDGILTADPTVVLGARNIRALSFREASELAYFGARVLHPETILPAVKRDIPVYVLNSRRPDWCGTLITAKARRNGGGVVKSIAYKEGITLLNIVSTRMFLAHGFLENVFDTFHKYHTVVHTVATSEVSVSVTIDNVRHLREIVRELRTFANVSVARKKAIVCVVGERLKKTRGVAARVMAAIGSVELNMISQGASEINISVVVDEADIDSTVRRLHREFFPEAPGGATA